MTVLKDTCVILGRETAVLISHASVGSQLVAWTHRYLSTRTSRATTALHEITITLGYTLTNYRAIDSASNGDLLPTQPIVTLETYEQ